MLRRILVGLLVLSAMLAAVRLAVAKEGDDVSNHFAGGVYYFAANTPIPSVLALSPTAGIVGLGYEMTGRWGGSPHWGWTGSFGYGIGGVKQKQSDPTGSNTDELTLTHWEVRLGMDYWDDCCDQTWYCGPGLVYMSTGGTIQSTGSTDFDVDPIKTFGLDARAGGQLHLGRKARLFGGMSILAGRSSWDQTESGTKFEENAWVTTYAYRGGIRWNY
jgi:hypothetical protein